MSVPLHPALVHLPLGLALLLPVGALVALVITWRRGPSRGLVTALVVAQALLVGSGFVSMQVGEADEERVEAVVPEPALEGHEERAQVMVLVGAVVLVAFAAAWLLARRPAAHRPALGLAAAGTIAVAVLALGVGHSGGELVYVHGAARALAGAGAEAATGAARVNPDRGGHVEPGDDD